MPLNVNVTSLGCSKNRVDTEEMMGLLRSKGFAFADQPQEADVFLINTCAFLKEARDEAIATIKEMLAFKKKKKDGLLVVTGCLPQLHKQKTLKKVPGIDVLLGVNDFHKVAAAIEEAYKGKKIIRISEVGHRKHHSIKRVFSTRLYAYLKIAEGCSNNCTYCLIPSIRGPLRSKPEDVILKEAKALVDEGFKEIILIAQDTTAYGTDLAGSLKLPALLDKLNNIKGLRWLRLLYLQPHNIDKGLIQTIAGGEKICNYIDMPLQHVDDKTLSLMNRKSRFQEIKSLIKEIKNNIPEAALRTTIMVGFPGETKRSFRKLCKFVIKSKFDRLGCFCYSPEEGTKANDFNKKIPLRVRVRRKDKLMKIQRRISRAKNRSLVGKTMNIIVEDAKNKDLYWGRSQYHAPDVDGGVLFYSKKPLVVGEFVPVYITKAETYNLMGEVCIDGFGK